MSYENFAAHAHDRALASGNIKPPPPASYLLIWSLPLLASFFVFGIARPLVADREVTPSLTHIGSGRSKRWWVVRLHLCVSTWLLFYCNFSVCAYLLLPTRVLLRLRMLPLSNNTTYGWRMRELRRALSFGIHLYDWDDKMYTGRISVVKSVESLASSDGPVRDELAPVVPLTNSEMWKYRSVVLAALVVTLFTLYFLASMIFRLSLGLPPCGEHRSNLALPQGSEEEEHDEDDDKNDEFDISFFSVDNEWWNMGNPDDACVDSPEAQAEEERLRSREQKRQNRQLPEKKTQSVRSVVWECWPLFASVCYSALYAISGGVAPFMWWVFPSSVVIVIVGSVLV
ncbi:hypothetical protein, conserved [Trypanosoma brucei gambiense DAL972]|uniref:Uncharacterized protein n=1 Tax=Trypanosoma brucei gambiense (strain MHOM/CI/86/DAL972) TaxID=679716 RepID=D0A9Z4_TRYB9|nr:hypothetical protein, conserved [Trypanosoma brucei gambiense DAL972]CBH18495.1 hypothetical protein, conserved [Trypanosoma brucei gambiense DAL972]|eukprot:XP_011780759.1 hypothetical protein, conserved [Trypanosoma brucei gambiense DAL972]